MRGIDALLLTHDHADAILGMDDLRDVQKSEIVEEQGVSIHRVVSSLGVYASQRTVDCLQTMFPYLFPKPKPAEPVDESKNPTRYVAKLQAHVIDDEASPAPPAPFTVCSLEVLPLRVLHGGDYISYGFMTGPPSARFVYLSDISAMLPETDAVLKAQESVALMVVDALFVEKVHSTHMNLTQALYLIRLYRPKRAVLVGMSHGVSAAASCVYCSLFSCAYHLRSLITSSTTSASAKKWRLRVSTSRWATTAWPLTSPCSECMHIIHTYNPHISMHIMGSYQVYGIIRQARVQPPPSLRHVV